MARDFVLFFPNQRVDLIDFNDLQSNLRGDGRASHKHLLMGGLPVSRVLNPWGVSASGPPDALVTVTSGTAVGTEELGPGVVESGVYFGLDDPSSQPVDFTALAPATYTIWIRWIADPGTQGARVFWDENAQQEDITNIDTRRVVSWDARAALASPGPEWQRIADVVWNGVSIAFGDITRRQHMLFEGDEDASFAHEWGDGPNDRDADRGRYGVGDLREWAQAVRRQITELAGDGQKWYEDWAYIKQDEFRIAAGTDFWTTAELRTSGIVTLGNGTDPIDIQGGNINMFTNDALATIDIFAVDGRTTVQGSEAGGTGLQLGATTGDARLTAADKVVLSANNGVFVPGGTTPTDNLNFTVTVEDMRSIPASTFNIDPADVGVATMNDAASPSYLKADGTSDVVRTRADIGTHVPNGSKLTNVIVEGEHMTGTASLSAVLIKVEDDGTRTPIAGPTAAAAGSGLTTISFTGLTEIVSHQTSSIYVKVTLDNNGGGVDGTRLYRAKFSWQQDELFPDPEVAS